MRPIESSRVESLMMSDYERVASAMDFIVGYAGRQPKLEEVAAHVNLSPYHFQRLFSRWAGVTPKRFLQALTVERAKGLLERRGMSLLEVADTVGLSSGSRLHDHFVQLEAVTPAQYRRVGEGLVIRHGRVETPFGAAFLASTARGVCKLAFIDDAFDGPSELARDWPKAEVVEDRAHAAELAARIFGPVRDAHEAEKPLSLLVRGTNFQISVWRALLRIPAGALASYRDVAAAVGRPDAARAVGAAVGANRVAFLIPCHRVICRDGSIGGYRWGTTRKRAMHAWEAACCG